MEYTHLLADRTRLMAGNVIREILKVAAQPGIISLAGGIPSPESFPMEIIQELTDQVLSRYQARPDEVHITSGSQGVLDAVAKLMISKGNKIAVEAPTYLGALSAFTPYEPTYVDIKMDNQGLIPASLETILTRHQIKFIYLVPTFHNPTGLTLSLERRQEVARIIKTHNALLIEDDPYSALRYRGEDLPPLNSFASGWSGSSRGWTFTPVPLTRPWLPST